MASLQGQQINLTYEGLIKSADNTSTPPFPPVALQYGDGTDTPISLGDGTSVGVGQITLIQGTPGAPGGGFLEVNGVGVNIGKLGTIDNGGAASAIWNGTYTFGQGFPGAPSTTVDFTNATVTGLPSAAGLVSNGANGMMSDASLTTNPAISTGTNSVVLGDNARDEGNDNAISIGLNARVREPGAICIGANTEAFSDSVAIGNSAVAVYPGVSIGENAKNFGGGNAVVIGKDTNTNYASNVVNIGGNTTLGSDNDDNIVVGSSVTVSTGIAERNIYIGNDINSSTAGTDDNVIIGHAAVMGNGSGSVVIGSASDGAGNKSVTIGKDAKVVGNGGIAIGDTAGYLTGANTDSVCIGKFSGFANAVETVQVGDSATAKAQYGVCIGKNARIESTGSTGMIAIGEAANSVATSDVGPGAIVIGQNAQIDGAAGTVTITNGIALGKDTIVSAAGAVAIGGGVTGAIADTVSLKALEVQTDSTPTAGGIIISDAGSTDRRINITSAGIPQIDSDPMLVNNSATNTAMTQVWSGTEAQYNALGTYDANTLYYLT